MARSPLEQLRNLKEMRERNAHVEYENARNNEISAQNDWNSAQAALREHKAKLSGDNFVVTEGTNIRDQVLERARHAQKQWKLTHLVKTSGIRNKEAGETATTARKTHSRTLSRFEATNQLLKNYTREAAKEAERTTDDETDGLSNRSTFSF
jgi:hypothetical protein